MTFSVYRKPTKTHRHLDFNSNHHNSHKRSVASSLFKRAETLCSVENYEEEVRIVKDTLTNNNYPSQFRRKPHRVANSEEQNGQISRTKYVSAPYIKGCSERLQRILKPFKIQLAHRSNSTLKSKLCKLKDRRLPIEQKDAVYKIECQNCNISYIGETSKKVGDRMIEHKNNITKKYERSQLYQHTRNSGHQFNIDGVKVLHQVKNSSVRKQIEAYHSEIDDNSFNRHCDVANCVLPVLRRL